MIIQVHVVIIQVTIKVHVPVYFHLDRIIAPSLIDKGELHRISI